MSDTIEIKEIALEEVWRVRHEVMWPEKNLEFVKLNNDAQGKHLGLYFRADLVSVISVFIWADEMQFRKFATRLAHQRKGFGSLLMAYVFELAKKQNIKRVWCNARFGKKAYYERFGMKITDVPYEKSGILYVTMEKHLLL